MSDQTGLLFVIIMGNDQADVSYTKSIGEKVSSLYGEKVKKALEQHTSMKFTA